jgi:hypothetical protein
MTFESWTKTFLKMEFYPNYSGLAKADSLSLFLTIS